MSIDHVDIESLRPGRRVNVETRDALFLGVIVDRNEFGLQVEASRRPRSTGVPEGFAERTIPWDSIVRYWIFADAVEG